MASKKLFIELMTLGKQQPVSDDWRGEHDPKVKKDLPFYRLPAMLPPASSAPASSATLIRTSNLYA